MNRELLTRPFAPEQIRQRAGHHGKTVSYVDVTAVIQRLNEACDAWSFEIVSHQMEGDEVIVLGKLTADGVVKTAFGGASITTDQQGRVVSLADDYKAASSDALKKAASLLGVALEMYGGQGNAASTTSTNPRPVRGSPEAVADRVTTKQLSALHSIFRRRGMSRTDVTALVTQRTGKSGLEQMSRAEASSLISELGNGAHHT
jgi:hypothetical protein